MSIRLKIIGVVILLGSVALVITVPSIIHVERSEKLTQERPATINHDEHPDRGRFSKFDPDLKAVAYRLENAAREWHAGRPAHDSFHDVWKEWERFSIVQIRALSTEQIKALAEWCYGRPDEYDSSEIDQYRQALFYVWGSRDYDAARSMLMAMADESGFLVEPVTKWRNAWLDELSDNFHHIIVGHAETNPSAAWDAFLADMSNPSMKYLVTPSVTPTGIFKNYAANADTECWELILNMCDDPYHMYMLTGYITGTQQKCDWKQKYGELSQALHDKGFRDDYSICQFIATRWAAEDSVSATLWYSEIAPLKGFDATHMLGHPFRNRSWKPLTESSVSTDAVADLINGMHISHEYNTREVAAVIEQLISEDKTAWAIASLQTIIGDSFHPWDIPYIKLIPKFEDQGMREALFIQAANAIPTRSKDFAATMNFDHPNVCYDAIQQIAGTMDLSPQARLEVNQLLKEIESREKEAQAVTSEN